jgi:hypothetical protein
LILNFQPDGRTRMREGHHASSNKSRKRTPYAFAMRWSASTDMLTHPRSTSLIYEGASSAFSASFSCVIRLNLRYRRILFPRICLWRGPVSTDKGNHEARHFSIRHILSSCLHLPLKGGKKSHMQRVATARWQSASGIAKRLHLAVHRIGQGLFRFRLVFPQQFVDRHIKRLRQPENDVPPRQFARPFPISQRGLGHARQFSQFLLRQIFFLPKMMEPRSISVAAAFWFSTHVIMLKAVKKAVAFYQCIVNKIVLGRTAPGGQGNEHI